MATGDALLANTRAIGHVTVESRESYIRRKMAENGWDRQTAIAQATHLYPEEMDDLRAPWANSQLYTGEGGHSPDTAAQALHDEGRLAEPTVDAFWDAVRGDIETIGKAKRRELDAAEAEAAAALAWGKERHDQTLAAIEMQDDAVGLGLGEARSSISGRRSTANVGNDVLTTLEDLDVGKDVFFDLKGRGRLRVTLGQDGPGGFGIMHIVEGRMLKDGQTLDGAIRTVLRVVEAAAHGENKGERQKRQRYEKDGAVAIIAHEDDKADGTPGKGDFVLTGYEEFANDAEREKADARAAALRRAGRYALPPHARSEEVVAALHRIIANLQNARKSDSARSAIGGLYSGGPTAYNRPSLRAIGTNDAGRAYGWGLYATTERDMAEGYAGATWRELANAFRFGGKTYAELTQDDPEAARLIEGYTATAIAEKRARGYDPEALKRDLQRDRAWLADYLADPENAPENMDAYPQSKQDRLRRFQTRLQNVERLLQADIAMTERGIPAVHEQLWWTNRPDGDESHLLTWDARISEENRKRVIEAVRSLGLTDEQLAEHFGAKWDGTPMTGEQAYGFVTEAIRDLAKLEGDHEALASQLLARHDVDGTVRHFPAGGSIYVAFSDEHLQVVRRWLWDEETQAFELDRSFTPPTPTMAEARATAGDDQAIAEAQASRSSIIGRIGARRLDWAGYRLTEDEHGTRRLVQGQDGRTLLEGLRDADAEVKALVGTDFTRGERARATRLSRSGPIRRDQVALAERWHRHETSENPETTSEDLAVRHWGWTLGKDGQWRLEIPYGILRAGVPDALQTIAAGNDAQASEAQSAALGDILEDEPLFAAYPELREAPVIPMPGDRDRWGRSVYGYAGNGTIALFTDKLRDQVKLLGTLYHEIQHLIQHIEGFESGEGRKVPTWSFYANAMGEAEARVAGASSMTPYGYKMDAYFHHALELTEGEIRDETGTWRRQTYDDLTFEAQRDKILRGQDDATQGILNQFANAKTLEALAKLAKKHLDVTAMTWGPKEGGGFEVTVEYDDDVIWWNTYGSETGALNSMRRIFLNRYANRTGEARASISGRRLSKKKPIEAMTYGARVGVFREAQKRPSNGSGIDEKRFVHVADLPPWAEELGLSPQLMANGRVLRKLAKKHNINARAFAKLIEAIERPVAAFIETPEKNIGGRRRQRQSDAIVLILEEHIPDRSGAPAPSSVVVLANYEGYTHLITAYGMDPKVETKYVGAVNNGLMQWVDKERAKKLPLLAATALALDSFNGASGPSTRTIAKPGAEVNTEVDPQTTSAWQKDAHGIYPDASGDLSRSSIAGSTAIPSTKFTIAEARQAIRDQNEKNPKGYTNRETGNVAFINSTQMREMTNPNALGKSKENGFSNWEHLHAVALAPTLYENATLVRDDPDTKHGDPHVRIMRYAADIVIDRAEGLVQAKAWLTVKTSEQRGHRVYSLELLELTDARLITEDTASTALPRARDITRTIANPAGEVNIENAPRSRLESE